VIALWDWGFLGRGIPVGITELQNLQLQRAIVTVYCTNIGNCGIMVRIAMIVVIGAGNLAQECFLIGSYLTYDICTTGSR